MAPNRLDTSDPPAPPARRSPFGFISRRDHGLMRRVHRWHPPSWIKFWMLAATRAGDGWLWCVIGALVLIWGGEERYRAVATAGLSAGLGVALFQSLKRMTGRKRPCELEPHCWANLLPPDQFSFPSGHTITAFAVAVSFSLFYPPLAWFLFLCAFSIGASRIVLGMHFLSDVFAGALIGAGLGYSCYIAFAA